MYFGVLLEDPQEPTDTVHYEPTNSHEAIEILHQRMISIEDVVHGPREVINNLITKDLSIYFVFFLFGFQYLI